MKRESFIFIISFDVRNKAEKVFLANFFAIVIGTRCTIYIKNT